MAKQDERGTTSRFALDEYRDMLRRFHEELTGGEDIGKEQFAESVGVSRQVVWRALSPGKTTKIGTIDRVATGLRKALPEARIPPPVVSVRDADHYDWCLLGDQLQQLDPEEFERILKTLKTLVTQQDNVRETRDELWEAFTNLQHPSSDRSDK